MNNNFTENTNFFEKQEKNYDDPALPEGRVHVNLS